MGFLGDSHIKGCIFSTEIEGTILETKSEDLMRTRGGASIEELQDMDTAIFKEAEGMVISAGHREMAGWESSRTTEEKERLVEELADKVVNLAQSYMENGRKVLYIAPPIPRDHTGEQEQLLESAVQRKAPDGLTIAAIPSKMIKGFERDGRKKTMDTYLADKKHMKVGEFTTMFKQYAASTFGWSLSKNGKEGIWNIVGKKVASTGRCNKCGSYGCKKNKGCKARVHCTRCENHHHDTRVCPTMRRPCIACGLATDHNRIPCNLKW